LNKLHQLLDTVETPTRDAFEKAYRKTFGIPAELQDYDGSIIFKTHDELFSIDFENNLLWYINNTWEPVATLEEARHLWKTKKK
jgi:hypothetical protein